MPSLEILRCHRPFAVTLLSGIVLAAPALAQKVPLGRNLAAACANCHGTNGRAQEGMPTLAGMPSARLTQMMNEFRSGARPATVMHQVARGYTDEQIRRLADYFSEQAAK